MIDLKVYSQYGDISSFAILYLDLNWNSQVCTGPFIKNCLLEQTKGKYFSVRLCSACHFYNIKVIFIA